MSYSKVMKKLNLSMEEVEAEAKKRNIVIGEEHFDETDTKRGRPKKEVKEVKEVKEAVRPKGRPKKEEKVVEIKSDDKEDLFAALVTSSFEEVKEAKEEAKEEAKGESRKTVEGRHGGGRRHAAGRQHAGSTQARRRQQDCGKKVGRRHLYKISILLRLLSKSK